jgi:hypothetical protein
LLYPSLYNRPSNITVFNSNFQPISVIRLHIANVELLQALNSGIVCTASLVATFFPFNRPAGMPFTILDPNTVSVARDVAHRCIRFPSDELSGFLRSTVIKYEPCSIRRLADHFWAVVALMRGKFLHGFLSSSSAVF